MGEVEILVPNACPVCGSATVTADNEHGWNCVDEHCVWSANYDPELS